jgi:endonuclease YncB( thermonuclease family)
MKPFAIAAALALLAAAPALAADVVGTVSHIVDGDTFDIQPPAGKVRIRFCGIDTPERGQPRFDEARVALERMIDRKTVRCVPVGQGTPCDERSRPTNRDRIVAQCFLGPVDIAAEMARAGLACDWPKFSGGHYRINASTCQR